MEQQLPETRTITLECTLPIEVIDWLNERSQTERCTISDFTTVILNAVCINSIINQKQKQNETQNQEN